MPKLAFYKVALWTNFGETKVERLMKDKIIWTDKFRKDA